MLSVRPVPHLLAALALATACTPDPHGLAWGVRFRSADDQARAAVVRLSIGRGACESDDLYIAEVDVGSSTMVAMPPLLEPGSYCFAGRVRDASCVVYARGVREVELPTDESPLIVFLEPVAETMDCEAGCVAGRCDDMDPRDAAAADGGDDAGATDGGVDASAGRPDGAVADAAVVDAAMVDAATDAGLVCTGSRLDCDGMASNGCETDISRDPLHCGGCGRSCGEAECMFASCRCNGGLTYDGAGGCVDTTEDPRHCGTVGHACADLEYCVASSCVCRPGLTPDGSGGCVDLRSDPRNCGDLGTDCSTMGSMTACRGTCEDRCNTMQTDCSRACVDTSSDVMHCGACGMACDHDELCLASGCRRYEPAPCDACPCPTCPTSLPNCRVYGDNVICHAG